MTDRIGRYYGLSKDILRARQTVAFCDAIWQLYIDPNGLQDWEIDSLNRLEREAMEFVTSHVPLNGRLGGKSAIDH